MKRYRAPRLNTDEMPNETDYLIEEDFVAEESFVEEVEEVYTEEEIQEDSFEKAEEFVEE